MAPWYWDGMLSNLVEAFELLVDAEALGPRLEAAEKALGQLPELEAERGWIRVARERLPAGSYGDLLDRAVRLPELEKLKGERGKLLQGAVADEVERLQASIVLAGGERSPLLEVVFLNIKVPALRKCGRAELERFCGELEHRLTSSYAKRVLGTERYRGVNPVVKALGAAMAKWSSVFVDPPAEGEVADRLREELTAAANAVELRMQQARLLAQAALLPATDLLDAAGVVTKGKRKLHPMLENDPPDPLLPTAEERAELADLNGAA
jgi:hypothetical protein